MKMSNSKPHIVVIPALSRGHLTPFLNFSKLLASNGLKVSFITTPANSASLQSKLDDVSSSNLDIKFVPFPLPPIEGIDTGIESTENVSLDMGYKLLMSSHKLAPTLEDWLRHQQVNNSNPPICIISDMFTRWVHHVGTELGIAPVAFQSFGAFSISATHSIMFHTPRKTATDGNEEYFELSNLSFERKMKKSDMLLIVDDPEGNSMQDFVKEEMNLTMEAQGMVFNSFYELEAMGFENMRSITGAKPLWSIGPILPSKIWNRDFREEYDTRDPRVVDCLQWLDSQRPLSVVYVCFGSQIVMGTDQIRALALGLEASGKAFLWAMKKPSAGDVVDVSPLPDGFEDRIRESKRGMIIWGTVPQLLLLSHPSAGCFLTHCGWNSMMESICLGVPMITWPLFAEQAFNSKLIVEHLGVAVNLCVGAGTVPQVENVSEVVRRAMEEKGEDMRRRVQELSNMARRAVERGGSSHSDLQLFVDEMHKIQEIWVAKRGK